MSEKMEDLTPNQQRALGKALAALETMASLWGVEIGLSRVSEQLAMKPEAERAKAIAAFIEQAFIEGAYRHYLDRDPAAQRELESDSQPGGGEAVKVDAVRANFTPFYIMSNVRRIVPAYYNKQRANWVLAMDVFAVGSRSARQICWDAGIDPDGYAIISVSNGAAPSAGNGGAEGE